MGSVIGFAKCSVSLWPSQSRFACGLGEQFFDGHFGTLSGTHF